MKTKLHYSILILIAACIYAPSMLQAQNNPANIQAPPPPCPTCFAGTHGVMVNSPNASPHAPLAPSRRVGNGNGSVGQSYILQNSCGLNYVSFSQLTETRTAIYNFNANGHGFPANISFTAPCGGLAVGGVLVAYAYWSAEYTEPSAPAATLTITNPALAVNTYTSTIIGTGGSTCWSANGTACYRANVTSAINGSGNYAMNLTGFANVGWEVNGITVIVVYKDPTGTYTGSLSIWDGCVVLIGGTYNTTLSGFTTCAASPHAAAFQLASDMQQNINGNQNDENFNGSAGVFSNDFWNDNTITTTLTNGQSSCVFDGYTNNGGDCWALTAYGLYWQNTTCVVCQPANAMHVAIAFTNPTCNASNGSATAHVTGGVKPYSYSWSPRGGNDSTATGLSGGTYTVTVSSPCDTVTATVVLIGNTLAYTNDSVNVNCNGGNNGFAKVNVSGGTPPYNYAWSPNIDFTDSATNLTAGQYTVTVHDNAGCNLSDIFTITQPPVLTAPITPVPELCNGGNNASATANTAGGTPPYGYSWSTFPSQINATATGLTVGTYTLEVTDSHGCPVQNIVIITQPTQLTVSLTGPQVICIRESGVLTALTAGGTSPYSYSWSWSGGSASRTLDTVTVSPASNTTYTCLVTDANGCSLTSSITVDLGPPLLVTTSGPASTCSGISIILCGNATGGFGLDSYTWQPGNLSGPCISVAPTVSTTYSLTVLDGCGSDTTVKVFVFVNPLPDVAVNADIQQGCSPLCVQFHDLSALTTGNMASWSWNFGNKDSSHKENPAFCYTKPGNFTINLTVVSDSGCSSSLNIPNMISVYSHPVAKFDPAPQPTTILTPDIQFTDKSTDPYGIVYWFWNFDDNMNTTKNTSNMENPSHTYSDTGTYCARLVTMNMHGCTDTTTDCIVIDPIFNLYIPSGFTPNGAGINEVFQAKGSYIKSFEMYIFDRWGMQLFHSNNINNGWNGTVNGGSTIVQEDTYIYQIYVTDTRNKSHSYVGQINLLK